jgi:hypothetical protein
MRQVLIDRLFRFGRRVHDPLRQLRTIHLKNWTLILTLTREKKTSLRSFRLGCTFCRFLSPNSSGLSLKFFQTPHPTLTLVPSIPLHLIQPATPHPYPSLHSRAHTLLQPIPPRPICYSVASLRHNSVDMYLFPLTCSLPLSFPV